MSTDTDDEYGVIDAFAELTEADYAQIDQAVAAARASLIATNIDAAAPTIAIEIERTDEIKRNLPISGQSGILTNKTRLEVFRGHKVLSVTDFTSPTWCEVQYEYGLLQRRSKPVSQRPNKFTSAQGREISVSTSIAVKNEKVTNEGKVMHAELEREVYSEQVIIRVQSLEEQWALRLMQLYTCMLDLISRELPLTREIPVFGILHGEVILGMIDEISSTEDPQLILHIVDTKTRRIKYLPSDSDAYGSRMQVMLYHRLLCDLLSTSTPFDFPRLWGMVEVNANRPFSPEFLRDCGYDPTRRKDYSQCLSDLVTQWHNLSHAFQGAMIHNKLKLIYRYVSVKYIKRKRNSLTGKKTRKETRPLSTKNVEEKQLVVIEASLAEYKGNMGESSGTGKVQEHNPIALNVEIFGDGVAEETEQPEVEHHEIIGTREFDYDEDLLERHVTDMLNWWHSKRSSRGVPVEHSRRCFTCEYADDCEWREEKAAELTARNRAKKG